MTEKKNTPGAISMALRRRKEQARKRPPVEWVKVTRQVPERTVRTIAGERILPATTITEWHTQRCLDDQERYKEMLAEYTEKWPNHCRECNGWGGTWYNYDPSPPGISLSPGYMTELEPCDLCCTKSLCPRCGELLPEEWWQGDDPCPLCNWNWGQGLEDALPDPPECFCWERRGLSEP